MGSQLIDRFNRPHDYLRISVTDRCNLRCVYCMPEEGVEFVNQDSLLTYEEIAEVVRVGAEFGIRKIRLTGGEPLVRKDIELLIEKISNIDGIEDIALTTNGIYLAKMAEKLKDAGLTRVNISLDTLKQDRFKKITRGGKLEKVLAGIDAAYRVGLEPLKINTVLIKGFNDDEIGDFLKMSYEQELQIRFIEYMPIGHGDDFWKNSYLPLEYVLDTAKKLGYEFEDSENVFGNGPAKNLRIKGAKGTIGLIHPISDRFCSTCNRLRLTAEGYLKSCLYWDEELYVRPHINNREELIQIFMKSLYNKPENHEMAKLLNSESQSQKPTVRRMSQIGG
ncbi:cyclic pyranopterin phosphate synthase [Vulcanibacillus modesticaldus]|uniref:GTP 3',8-cyclase n=1 Tax=Vulcanibacillus modesticaldus TaxID=337097 RepID=A0A1D2YWG5_9BACI|nr:GTP 3',8-cyclase MoaA [Vulcanibacillus modesticaldus]OEG00042.1 cyclic pyranopterin phosphate synthase [Vulcanibacillus modesticaldus]